MTQPAKRDHKDTVAKLLKRQLWILSIIILLAWISSLLFASIHHLWIESVAIGGLLNFCSQAIFAWFAFRYTGYHERRQIVQQLYRGQLIKWIITLAGFAIIFINIQPLSVPALFIGFVMMQISYGLMLWQFN